MNIAKKLLFSLLLCGSVFAVTACGDDGGKAKENEKCTKEKMCDDKLVCVVAAAADTEGTCKKTCVKDEECAGAAAGSCADATVLKDSTAGKVCPATTQQQQQPAEGTRGGACKSAAPKCDDAADECKDDGTGTMKCLAKTATTPAEGTRGGACKSAAPKCDDAADECKDDGTGAMKCLAKTATTPAAGATGGDCKSAAPKCDEATDTCDSSSNKCVASDHKKGSKCSSTVACGANLVCLAANAGDETGTCADECVDSGASPNCSSPQACKADASKKVKNATEDPKTCQN